MKINYVNINELLIIGYFVPYKKDIMCLHVRYGRGE